MVVSENTIAWVQKLKAEVVRQNSEIQVQLEKLHEQEDMLEAEQAFYNRRLMDLDTLLAIAPRGDQ